MWRKVNRIKKRGKRVLINAQKSLTRAKMIPLSREPASVGQDIKMAGLGATSKRDMNLTIGDVFQW